MGLRKILKDFRDWCPQPPNRLPVKLRSYMKVPIAATLAAALIFSVFLSLPSFQKIPTQPATQLPQILPENSTQPSPTPIPAANATSTPISIPTPTPTPSPPTITQVADINGSFELTISIEKTVFRLGEPVNITLTLTSIGNQTVNLEDFMGLLDFVVTNGTNNFIYEFTRDGMMNDFMLPATLQPGGNITHSLLWPLRYSGPNPGPAVSPGTYYIVGKTTVIVDDFVDVYTLQTAPLEIMIVNS